MRRAARGTSWSSLEEASDLTHQQDCGRYTTLPKPDQCQLQGVQGEKELQGAQQDCDEGEQLQANVSREVIGFDPKFTFLFLVQ